jgi:hypothetical protein
MRIKITYYKETADVVYISDKFAPLFQTDMSDWTNADIDLADELNEFLDGYVEKYGTPMMGYDVTEE